MLEAELRYSDGGRVSCVNHWAISPTHACVTLESGAVLDSMVESLQRRSGYCLQDRKNAQPCMLRVVGRAVQVSWKVVWMCLSAVASML